MNCDVFAALLDQWADNELSNEDAAEMEAHLAECAKCKALMTLRAEMSHMLDSSAPSESFRASWRESIKKEEKIRKRNCISRSIKFGTIAAALALIIGAITRMNLLPLNVKKSPEEIPVSTGSPTFLLQTAGKKSDDRIYEAADEEAAVMEDYLPAGSFSTVDYNRALEPEPILYKKISISVLTDHFDDTWKLLLDSAEGFNGYTEKNETIENEQRTVFIRFRFIPDQAESFLSLIREHMTFQSYEELQENDIVQDSFTDFDSIEITLKEEK